MAVKEVGKSVKKNLASFLSQKPIWAFWLVYCVLTAIMFGIFYTMMYLVVLQWWIPVVVIIAIGMIWGTVNYTNSTHEIKEKEEPKKEA
ncbi:MAG TPA: hypothetical protein DCL73_02770 [Treponema sp.]|nr:hypothetical protein [Treponema sp.]